MNIRNEIDQKLAEVETLLLSADIETNIKDYMLFQLRKIRNDIINEIDSRKAMHYEKEKD